jgi:hypothetical protein
MQMIRIRPVNLIVIWLTSFCFAAIVIGCVIDAPHLLLLQRECSETDGRVTRVLAENHGLVEVAYDVAGRSYQRTFPPHLNTHVISEGEPVEVYYSPHDPTIAFVAPPSEILAEQLPSWIIGSVFLSGAILAMVLVFGTSGGSLERLSAKVISPRMISTGITVGVFAGMVSSVYFGTLNMPKVLGGVLVVGGCTIFLILAWQKKFSWGELLGSRTFWIAVALAVAGNVLDSVLSA